MQKQTSRDWAKDSTRHHFRVSIGITEDKFILLVICIKEQHVLPVVLIPRT